MQWHWNVNIFLGARTTILFLNFPTICWEKANVVRFLHSPYNILPRIFHTIPGAWFWRSLAPRPRLILERISVYSIDPPAVRRSESIFEAILQWKRYRHKHRELITLKQKQRKHISFSKKHAKKPAADYKGLQIATISRKLYLIACKIEVSSYLMFRNYFSSFMSWFTSSSLKFSCILKLAVAFLCDNRESTGEQGTEEATKTRASDALRAMTDVE